MLSTYEASSEPAMKVRSGLALRHELLAGVHVERGHVVREAVVVDHLLPALEEGHVLGVGEARLAGDRLQHFADAGDLLREAVQQEAAGAPGVFHTEPDQRHVLRGEGVAGGEELIPRLGRSLRVEPGRGEGFLVVDDRVGGLQVPGGRPDLAVPDRLLLVDVVLGLLHADIIGDRHDPSLPDGIHRVEAAPEVHDRRTFLRLPGRLVRRQQGVEG